MNIEIAIKNACKELKKNKISTALLDSELLLSQVIKKDRKFILLNLDKELDENTQNSFKDELVTIVILIPTILVFIPGMEEIVKNGFARLNELPEWYTYLLFLTVSAALGIRGLDKFKNVRK